MFKKFNTIVATLLVLVGVSVFVYAQNSHNSATYIPQSSGSITAQQLPPNTAMVDVQNTFTLGLGSSLSNGLAPQTITGGSASAGGLNGWAWTNTAAYNVNVYVAPTNALVNAIVGLMGSTCIMSNTTTVPYNLQPGEWLGLSNVVRIVVKPW
jgi:hypothetical protein